MPIQKDQTTRFQRAFRWKPIQFGLMVLLAVFGSVIAYGQPSSHATESTSSDRLPSAQGKIIAQGSNTTPSGLWHLTSYRIEEFSLPKSVQVTVRGHTFQATKAWHVTVLGGPFSVRDTPIVIWAGDTPLGNAQPNPDLREATTRSYDWNALRDASALYLSYGLNKEDRWQIPESLNLKNNSD